MRRQAPTLVAVVSGVALLATFTLYWALNSPDRTLPPLGLVSWVCAGAAGTTVVSSYLCWRGGSRRSVAWALVTAHGAIVALTAVVAFRLRFFVDDPPAGEPNNAWLLLPFRTSFVLAPVAGVIIAISVFASWRRSRAAA